MQANNDVDHSIDLSSPSRSGLFGRDRRLDDADRADMRLGTSSKTPVGAVHSRHARRMAQLPFEAGQGHRRIDGSLKERGLATRIAAARLPSNQTSSTV